MYAKFQFTQTAVAIQYDIFQALSQEYLFLKDELKSKYNDLEIEESDPKLFRNIYKIFISLRG